MSVALWYYCNLHDETSAVVPVVQERQNVAKGDAKAPVVRRTDLLVSGDEDDELAVARTTYILLAALCEKVEAEKITVVDTEPAAVQTVPEQEIVEYKPNEVEVIEVEEETTEEATVEVVQEAIEEALVLEKEVAECAVEKVVDGVEKVVESAEAVVDEVATVVETVHDVVETVAVVEEKVVEAVVAQAEVEAADEPTAEPEGVAKEEVPQVSSAEAPASPVLSSDVPDEKLVDKAEEAILDMIAEPRKLVTRMPSIPEDEENVVGVEDDESADVDQVTAIEKTEDGAEVLPAKPITDDESETETQSEISEATAMEAVESFPVAKTDEEPESEIDETMVIDPVVAAKEAAKAEAQTSSYGFIPEQLRKNSYAVSSVAVAITTAIVATLVARR